MRTPILIEFISDAFPGYMAGERIYVGEHTAAMFCDQRKVAVRLRPDGR